MQRDGDCAKCGRRLVPGHWAVDHVVALANGGEHRETNMQALCVSPCHSQKTALDVAQKSKVYRAAAKDAGIRKPSRIRSQGFVKRPAQRSASRPIERRT
jgi:5-methylcytosine-specific restriction endonuclease McrA